MLRSLTQRSNQPGRPSVVPVAWPVSYPVARFRRFCWLLLPVLFLTACATTPSSDRAGDDRDVIDGEYLRQTDATNVLEVIERVRPNWLVSRGARSMRLQTEIIVVLDETYFGGPETLRNFRPEEFRMIRYIDGATATSTFLGIGSRHVEAAIVLETRSR